jgi:hypothetical protein
MRAMFIQRPSLQRNCPLVYLPALPSSTAYNGHYQGLHDIAYLLVPGTGSWADKNQVPHMYLPG